MKGNFEIGKRYLVYITGQWDYRGECLYVDDKTVCIGDSEISAPYFINRDKIVAWREI